MLPRDAMPMGATLCDAISRELSAEPMVAKAWHTSPGNTVTPHLPARRGMPRSANPQSASRRAVR